MSEFKEANNCYMIVIQQDKYREVWYIGFKDGKWSAEVRAKLHIKDLNFGLPYNI